VSKKKLPQPAQIAIAVVAVLLLGLVGYFALVKPQKGKAVDLSAQIAEQDKQIGDARVLLAKSKGAEKVRVADIFRLTKAMPDQADEAGIILELTNAARQSGIEFQSISPQGATALSGYQVVPIDVVFQGNFFQLTDFLFRLRNLVDVRRGALAAGGRLFTVDSVEFQEGELKFPQIAASLTVDAYIYGTGSTVSAPPQTPAPAGTATPGSTTSGTTTSTTTTSTTTTPASTTPTTPTTPTTTTPTPAAAPAPSSTAATN
jgi:Tfp pilus assembly protein PilO